LSCFEAAFGFASVARSESQHACGRVRERPRGHRDGGTRRGPVLEPWGHTWGTGSQKRDARPQQTPVLELGCHRTAVARPPREGCAAMPACGGATAWSSISQCWAPACAGNDPAKPARPPRVGGDTRGLQRLPVSPPRCPLPGDITLSPAAAERITQTVEITKHVVDIEEKGVKLRLTIVDTPGFGDAVNNTEWCVPWRGVAVGSPQGRGALLWVPGWDAQGSSGCGAEPWEALGWGSRESPGVWRGPPMVTSLSPQLEAGGRLHRPAVRAVFPRRKWPQPEKHPGQPRPLLHLLHLALRPRVRAAPARAAGVGVLGKGLGGTALTGLPPQSPSPGRGVHESPAPAGEHRASAGQG